MIIKKFNQFINERSNKNGIFLTYDKLMGYTWKEFENAFKKLNKENKVVYDKDNDVSFGYRDGSNEAMWKYFHETGELHHSESRSNVLGLVNFYNRVSKNHPWS